MLFYDLDDKTKTIIESQGLEQVTTRRLAELTGYNSAKLYFYFRNLDELVNEALFMEQVYSEVSAWYPWAADLLDALIDRNWHSCTHDIAVKYKRTDRAIQISKKKFLKYCFLC